MQQLLRKLRAGVSSGPGASTHCGAEQERRLCDCAQLRGQTLREDGRAVFSDQGHFANDESELYDQAGRVVASLLLVARFRAARRQVVAPALR